MSFSKVRHGLGTWNIRLRPDTPGRLLDLASPRTTGFATVLVTAADMPAPEVSRANSIYTGVFHTRDRFELSGTHSVGWIGDSDGKGPWPTTGIGVLHGQLWMRQWVDEILSHTVFTPGGVWPTPATQPILKNWDWRDTEISGLLNLLTFVVTNRNSEWEATENFEVNVGTVAALYGAAPTVVLSPLWSGRELAGLRGVRCDVRATPSVADYTTRLNYEFDAVETPNAVGPANPVPFVDPTGVDVNIKRRAKYSTITDEATADARAAQELADWEKVHESFRVTTDQSAVLADLRVGERVWLHDDTNGVSGSEFVAFRGHELWAAQSRIEAVDMPFESGMGLYLQRGNSEPVRFTDHVIPDGPGATIRVGDVIRSKLKRAVLR